MPDFVNVVTPEGKAISVPAEAVGGLVEQGYRLESVAQGAARAHEAGVASQYDGALQQAKAAAYGFGRGASLGLMDVALRLDNAGAAEDARQLRDRYSKTSLGGEILGALATAVPTGGTSLEAAAARTAGKQAVERIVAREAETAIAGAAERSVASRLAGVTPSGWLSGKAVALAERGAEKGLAKRIGYQAAGGALEGGVQNVGAYVSDVALGDRDLSAEGLAGSFRDGALLGGGTAGMVGLTERGLQRARGLFPESSVTREAAEASQREATRAVGSLLDDTADLESRAVAAIDDIKRARAIDPDVQAHAAKLRAEKEATAAARRAQAEAGAAAAQARAEAAQIRTERVKSGPQPRKRGTAVGTPSDGVPVAVDDLPMTPPTGEVLPYGAAVDEKMRDVAAALGAPYPPIPEASVAEAVGASDLEKALAATNDRLKGGAGWDAVQAEGKAARGVEAADELTEAVTAIDPTAAKLAQLRQEVRLGRQGVADWLATVNQRADAKVAKQVEAGILRRDDDVIRSLEGGRDVLGAQLGVPGNVGPESRGVRSRLRNPYTDEELIAKAENNPTFVDTAAPRGELRMTARDDLVERIIAGEASPSSLHIEELRPRIDPATGEVLPGLSRELRPATPDDILGAIERNRRNPEFGSFVPDDIMAALRGRLDLPDDLERAIPAIAKLERAEADLAEMLGDRATPGSLGRVPSFRSAEAAHAETRALADTQRMAAIEDGALPAVAEAAAQARAEDLIGTRTLPTEKLPPAADVVSLPDLPEARALGGKAQVGEKASKLADVAAAIEVMSTLGIPGLPRAEDIPLVGPILGLYLKARAGMSVWKKLGGKLPASVESKAAGRAAQTRDRIAKAVNSMLGTAAGAVGRQPVRAAATAEVLSRSLFSEGETKRPTRETAAEMWARHRDELAAAQRPGAVERVLRNQVPTGDPRLAQSLVATAKRKIAYLSAKMPRPPAGLTDPDAPPWRPTDAQAEQWARIVTAADDPASVLERAAAGQVSMDEIDTVRNVYPRLYQEAQQHLLEAIVGGATIPYQRRIQLGALFGLPLVATEDRAFLSSMQAGYDQPPPDAPQPRPSANVDLSSAAFLQEQNP